MTEANYMMGIVTKVIVQFSDELEVSFDNPNVEITVRSNTHEFQLSNGNRRVIDLGDPETDIKIDADVSPEELLESMDRIEQGIRMIRGE